MTDHRPVPPHQPPSPCVNICIMHKTRDLCVGCFRTLDEIATWGSLTADRRQAILDSLPSRRDGLKRRRSDGAP